MLQPISDNQVKQLWQKLSMMFGHAWVTNYGEADDGTWQRGLYGVTGEELAHGLEKCLSKCGQWPPTLPQFRQFCIEDRQTTQEKKTAYPALEGPQVTEAEAEANREKLKQMVKGFANKKPGKPKPLYNTDERDAYLMKMLMRLKSDGLTRVERLKLLGLMQ